MSEDKLDLILDKLESFQTENNKRFDAIDKRFDKIEQTTEVIKLTQENQNASLIRHEELLRNLVASQEKQNRIIEMLATRSIELESEIDEIKKAM